MFTFQLNRIPLKRPAWSWRIDPYAIGSIAAFWVIERTLVGLLAKAASATTPQSRSRKATLVRAPQVNSRSALFKIVR